MTEITLTFNRKHFEELYFRNGYEKFFLSPIAKSQTYVTMGFVIACLCSLLYSFFTENFWGLFFLLLLAVLLSSLELTRRIWLVMKWRKSVHEFIDGNEAIKNHKIILTENAFTLIQDSNEIIEQWSEIKRAEITEFAINLWGSTNYLIPRKAMTEEEYDFLKKEIGDRIKNCL